MKFLIIIIILITITGNKISAQCFSSVNPVSGVSSLLVLEKNSLKFIGLYNYGIKDKYYEGDGKSDYSLVKKADYNYIGTILAYGAFNKITIEAETGYFINKTYEYENDESKGYGFNSMNISSKISLISNHEKRFYSSFSAGLKIPFTRELQKVNGVEVPHELQPSTHAFGYIIQGFIVK
jgi:hypothetical protein